MTPSERATLLYLAAHSGQTLAEIADGMGRSLGTVRDTVLGLVRMHLAALGPGKGGERVADLTDAGRERAAQPDEPRRRVVDFAGQRAPTVTTAGLAVLQALVAAARPMSNKELANATGIRVGNLPEILDRLAREGYVVRGDPRPRYAPLVSLTQKGQRMANGDLAFTSPRVVHPAPEPATQAPQHVPYRDLDGLVPPSLRMRGGIRHPAIPKPAARPKGMRIGDWYRATSAPASPLHDACARGTA